MDSSNEVLFLQAHQTILHLALLSGISDEIRLVWKAPWRLGKILFFLTRYLAPVTTVIIIYLDQSRHLSTYQCKGLSQSSTVILSLRVWAVWGRSKWIAALLVIGFLVPISGIAIYTSIKDQYDIPDFYVQVHDSLGVCPSYLQFSGINESVIDLFIYLVVLEAVFFILTAYKAAEHCWYNQSLRGSSLVETFFKDGLCYNVVVLLTSTVTIVLRSTAKNTFMADTFLVIDKVATLLSCRFQMVIHSVFTSQMLLHLRSAAVEDTGLSRPLESMQFASNQGGAHEISTGNLGSCSNIQLPPIDEVQSWFGDVLQRTENTHYAPSEY
ncbi:hypothetical protein K435DRAFT_800644 [Dendrothele bispora CBS 962.96]|uniref:DUF6533 domain-containing protein n=1 Tax=Dendrothele bispora (strain CBS 962.96) TaxID=1314807 RepID=A0A4S8LS35_DENBC|nr:hypothetical protein K435DRAFT_800644 [Dendrothele bispora CBS 962.96]